MELWLRQGERATKTPVALSLNLLSPIWVIRRTPLEAETKGIGDTCSPGVAAW